MHTLLQDLAYAIRGLAKNRTFTLVAIFALALGVGANTAMFSVVNAVLLTDLPYPQPDRLVMLWERHLSSEKPRNVVGPANFLAWQESAKSFDAMGAFLETHGTVTGVGDEPISAQMRIASATVFPILGVRPALGRVYTIAEDVPSGPNVVVISYDMWKTRFGGQPSAIGRPFRLNGNLFTVVGVMPKDFHFYEPVDLWVPISFGPKHRDAQGRYLRVIARLKPGVTVARANDEMLALAKRRVQDAPKLNANWSANAVSLRENLVGDVRKGLLVLLGAVGFLLVIACANVANLLLARATDRQKEIAIRVSLGATPGRLVRQLLTESVVLSLAAAIAGLGLAALGTDVIVALIPKDFPAVGDVAIDGRVLAFTTALAVLTGIAFGLAPAIAAARGALHDTLKEGGRSGTALSRVSGSLRNALVVAEMSLAIVLLAGAGLMLRSFAELHAVKLGFQPEHAMMADINLPRAKYRSDTVQIAFYREAETRIAAIPGVKAVGAISFLPLSGQRSASSFTVAGRPAPAAGQEPIGDMRAVTPGYFRTMEIPIKAGRGLTDADLTSSPAVAVVSETLARSFWPNESAVGKYIDYEWFKMQHVLIVGIAGDVHHDALDVEPYMEIYRPLTQFPYNGMTLVVRGNGEPTALSNPLRDVVRAMDRDLPIGRMSPLTALVGESLGKSRLSTALFGLFGVVGLVLATIGIYGVMSYGVMQRTREFGVRMALGARPSDVRGMVVKQGARLTAIGIVLGLAGAYALTRLMTSLLFGVAPTDPLTYGGIAVLLGAVALSASYLPARHATKIDPVIALRNE